MICIFNHEVGINWQFLGLNILSIGFLILFKWRNILTTRNSFRNNFTIIGFCNESVCGERKQIGKDTDIQWFVWWRKANWKGYRYPMVCVVKESKLERVQISNGISCMGLTSSLHKYSPLDLHILSFWICWAHSIYAKNIDKSHISVENFDRVPQCSTEAFQCSSNGVLIRSKLAPSTEFDIVFLYFSWKLIDTLSHPRSDTQHGLSICSRAHTVNVRPRTTHFH